MGACGSSLSEAEKQQKKVDAEISKQAMADNKKEEKKIKMLLLGAGESGKSTIFKQMKIIYGVNHGYTPAELEQATNAVYSNILLDMKTLLEVPDDEFPPLADPEGLADAKARLIEVGAKPSEYSVDEELGPLLKAVWNDEGFQARWERRGALQVQPSLEYFMNNIDRIMKSNYRASEDDVLRVRVRTTGIVQENFMIDGVEFNLYDVGGQRNERKKWIHAFDGVTAVVFVAAISEYDQKLFEDNSVNRIDEALNLFDDICNSRWFEHTNMILFLNKKDLFREKLNKIPFRVDEGEDARFTDYDGPQCEMGMDPTSQEFEACYNAAVDYLRDKFLLRNARPNTRTVYVHVTCATDRNNIKFVFNATKDIILRKAIVNL